MLPTPDLRSDINARPKWLPWEVVWLVASAVLLVVLRNHAFGLPLETDECNYAYIAGRLLQGDRLYVDVWDHQPFGIFALFAAAIALFGDSPAVFRWLATAFSLISLLLIVAIVRRCSGRRAAFAAAVLFAISSADPGTAGEGCNREIFMNTLVLLAWHLVLAVRGPSRWAIVASGSSLALASAIKTVIAVHWAFLAVWMVVSSCSREGSGGQGRVVSAVRALSLFAAGPLLLWAGATAYFAATERYAEFLDAVFLFNLSYSDSAGGLLVRFARFFAPPRHPFVFESALPLWLCGCGAMAWLAVTARGKQRIRSLPVLLLLLAGYVAACLPGRSWPHYYYLLIPALVIAMTVAIGGFVDWIMHRPWASRLTGNVTSLALYVAPALWLGATEYRHYLSQPAFGITVKRYNSRDFWGRAQGRNVGRVTDPEDTVFVFGNEAEIYYYSGRRCASRYTMITGLQSGYAGHGERRKAMIAELEHSRPRLVMVLFDEPPFDEWLSFLRDDYGEAVGWDRHDRTGKPIMFVFARKDRPIESIDWDWDRSEVDGWHLGDRR